MTDNSAAFIRAGNSKIVFILSILVSLFWIFGQVINVYHFPFIGAIVELLWVPVVAMTFLLPVVSFIFLVKEKFSLRSLNLYSLLIVAATILIVQFLI